MSCACPSHLGVWIKQRARHVCAVQRRVERHVAPELRQEWQSRSTACGPAAVPAVFMSSQAGAVACLLHGMACHVTPTIPCHAPCLTTPCLSSTTSCHQCRQQPRLPTCRSSSSGVGSLPSSPLGAELSASRAMSRKSPSGMACMTGQASCQFHLPTAAAGFQASWRHAASCGQGVWHGTYLAQAALHEAWRPRLTHAAAQQSKPRDTSTLAHLALHQQGAVQACAPRGMLANGPALSKNGMAEGEHAGERQRCAEAGVQGPGRHMDTGLCTNMRSCHAAQATFFAN